MYTTPVYGLPITDNYTTPVYGLPITTHELYAGLRTTHYNSCTLRRFTDYLLQLMYTTPVYGLPITVHHTTPVYGLPITAHVHYDGLRTTHYSSCTLPRFTDYPLQLMYITPVYGLPITTDVHIYKYELGENGIYAKTNLI